jgi:hypothetical protein
MNPSCRAQSCEPNPTRAGGAWRRMHWPLLVAVSMSACSPALNWRVVQVEQAQGLVASFPCKPEHRERHVPWPDLPAGVQMHVLSCQTEGRTWALNYAVMPDVQGVGPALSHLAQQLHQNLAAASDMGGQQAEAGGSKLALNVRAQDLGPIQVPQMTPMPQAHGWQFAAQRPDGLGRPMDMSIRAWHFSHGLTVFQASVWQPAEAASTQSSEDVADVFLRGFHFPR